MKLSRYILMLSSCVVMALSLQAQGSAYNAPPIDDATESDYRSNVEDEEQTFRQGEDGQSSYVHLGISVITLIGIAFLLFITVKKKPNMESEINNENETYNNQAGELESIKIQLQQIHTLLLKQTELLNQFASQIANLQVSSRNSSEHKESDVRYIQRSAPQPLSIDMPTLEKATQDAALENIFIATASIVDNKVMLRAVEEQYANQAAFEIKVKGDLGIYRFNPIATKALLNYADTKIKPYCDITIDSGKVPSRIDTLLDGTIERCDDKWLVTKKAQIHIS